MVQETQLKQLFKYIETNWDVVVSQVDKTEIKRIFGGILLDEPVQTEQPSSQGKLDNSSMTYEEAVKHIISNKLTHKRAGSEYWYAYKFYGYRVHFCDESGKDMIWVRFDELDLNEWYPYKKPFDKERFEAMFRAVVASGEFESITEAIEQTEYNLNRLDSYYASKEGGDND